MPGLSRCPAPQIDLSNGATISSSTSGTGSGGSVGVTTAGALAVDGGVISASALGSQSGGAGTITVSANNISIDGGRQIASTTAEDLPVAVTSM